MQDAVILLQDTSGPSALLFKQINKYYGIIYGHKSTL